MTSLNTLLMLALTASLGVACKANMLREGPQSDSHIDYLVETDYPCKIPSDERIAQVKAALPQGLIAADYQNELAVVYGRMAGITDT